MDNTSTSGILMASNMAHKSLYTMKGTDLDGNTERIVCKQTRRRDESMRIIPVSARFIFARLFCIFWDQIFNSNILPLLSIN